MLFAQLVDRRLEWENYEVTLLEPKLIHVQDASIDSYERLEFPRGAFQPLFFATSRLNKTVGCRVTRFVECNPHDDVFFLN